MRKIMIVILSIFLFGCEKSAPDDKPTLTAPKALSLIFRQADNPSLEKDVEGVIDETTQSITVYLHPETKSEMLIPTLETTQGASSNIAALTPMDTGTSHLLKVYNDEERHEYTITFYKEATVVKGIKINDAESYFNKKTNTYYAPLTRDLWGKTVKIDVVGTGITASTVGSTTIPDGKSAAMSLTMNQEYEVKIAGEQAITAKLVVTGLPIIVLESSSAMTDLSNLSKTPCTISLIDPEQKGTRSHYNLTGEIRVRGNSASYYNKKSLALELHDKNTGEEIDKAFLNMRSDDDWILDAMYMEQLRMRNRISHDIWRDMHKPHYAAKEPKALSTNRGEMAEMFYNGEYMGIYCISEKVDRKQQDLNKTTGGLYKGESWGEECILKNVWGGYDEPYDDFFGGWQIQHPTEPNNWKPLLDFLQFAIESDFSAGASSTFGKGIADRVVMDNMVDFLLHLNIVNGTDNTGRNTFLGVYDTNSKSGEEAKFFYTPWDLDATFGTDWLFQQVDPNLFLGLQDVDVPSERTYGNFMLMKIAKYDIGGFGAKIKKRWAELRADKASEQNLVARFESYYDILNKSGAYAREKERWGANYQQTFYVDYDPQREIAYVKAWIPKHLKFIDSYIQNWESNVSKIVIKR